jgi:hypothetical protein
MFKIHLAGIFNPPCKLLVISFVDINYRINDLFLIDLKESFIYKKTGFLLIYYNSLSQFVIYLLTLRYFPLLEFLHC